MDSFSYENYSFLLGCSLLKIVSMFNSSKATQNEANLETDRPPLKRTPIISFSQFPPFLDSFTRLPTTFNCYGPNGNKWVTMAMGKKDNRNTFSSHC